ncbi:MAG: sugar kinase [Alphaproteobacteria bacterium]
MTAGSAEVTRAQQGAKRVACIGECMIELAHLGPTSLQMAFGGDTSNTAVYLARLTRGLDVGVDYVTALGDDLYSEAMLAFWQDEGVGTDLVARLEGRLPGLYTIRTDAQGERSFTYWRGQAAARDLLGGDRGEALIEALSGFDLVYLSGITLSILDPCQRERLFALLDAVRAAGGKVAFDGNFRPAGWPDAEAARQCFREVLGRTDIALPTLDDEQALFGDADADAVAARLHEHGVCEVVVKRGAAGCLLSGDGHLDTVATTPVDPVIDSTAAGDSFNAGYLAARLLGASRTGAAQTGHRLAGLVVRHRGAIIPKEAMAVDLTPALGDAGEGKG